MKFREVSNDPGTYIFYCPGCKMMHHVVTRGSQRPNWQFNDDVVKPTVNPSLLVRYPLWQGAVKFERVCHSFIREGNIQFLSDSTHDLAGCTVPLPDVDTAGENTED